MHRAAVFVIVLILTSFAAADTDTGWPCTDTLACQTDLGEDYYCHPDLNTCHLRTATTPPPAAPVPPPPTSPALEQRVATLETSVATLQQDRNLAVTAIAGTQSELSSLRTMLNSLENTINTRLTSITQSIDSLRQQIGGALTGQASLQRDLNETQYNVSTIRADLSEQQSFTSAVKGIFFVLLVIAAGLIVIYYLNRSKLISPQLDPKIREYIQKHIKRGDHFPQIKQSLLRAGWTEREITEAYKGTLTQTVQPTSKSNPKLLLIAGLALVLIVGVLFLLRGTVGKAIFSEKGEKEETHEVTYDVRCTPPHILTPTQDGCCRDENNNNQCDNLERDVQALLQGQPCSDNLQCGKKYCINGACQELSEIYLGSVACDKMCNYYSLKISTSDGEEYTIKPKRGSYTAVGAIEWKVLEAPDHCKGEAAVIPILIVRKDPERIISEEVITLNKGETSKTITHPTIPDLVFTLKVDKVYELCN